MLGGIGAILAGFVLWTVLWLGSNAILVAAFPGTFGADGSTNSVGMLLVILASSVIFSLISGFVTARLARTNELRVSLILGILLLVVGVLVQMQYWTVIPLWYHLSFLVLLIPGVLAGSRLRLNQIARSNTV